MLAGKFQDYMAQLGEKLVIFAFFVVWDLESLRLFKLWSIVLPYYSVILGSLF
jgi:hypothetical protein